MNPYLYLLFFVLITLFSCNTNRESKRERILRQFDSINQTLERPPSQDSGRKGVGAFKSIGAIFLTRENIYDSIETKYAGTAKYPLIRQMHAETDACLDYLADLKRAFYIACGDATGSQLTETNESNISLTNEFFSKEPATYILSYLLTVKKAFSDNTSSTAIRNDIKKLATIGESKSSYTAEYWRNKYVKDVPPVAVITILNSFGAQVKNIEASILSDYLNQ